MSQLLAEVDEVQAHSPARSFLPAFLRPARAAQLITDPREVSGRYAYYRPRVLLWTTIGYGMFYFVRKNLTVAQPVIEKVLHISKSDLGIFLTLNGVLYGISKFLNGIIADRADGRKFMATALFICAGLSVCFGSSSTKIWMGIFWMLNGWFQGMGYPPCARLLTHWFSPKEIATKMSYWNSSHCMGASGILLLCAYLIQFTGNWRLCFFVPAGIASIVAVMLLLYLHDTPESVGLPEVEGSHVADPMADAKEMSAADYRAFLRRRVFSNKYIWLFSAGNLFVYTLRYSVFDWGPTMLKEAKDITLLHAAWTVVGFEFAGLLGMLLTGWMADRLFGGKCAPICCVSMLMCAVVTYLFWKTPPGHYWANTGLLTCLGFFVYIPQALVAVAVVNLATKRAAATAVGLTSIFGYASTVLSGWGLGTLVQHMGWNRAFPCLIAAALIGAMLFAIALPAKAHDYAPEPEKV